MNFFPSPQNTLKRPFISFLQRAFVLSVHIACVLLNCGEAHSAPLRSLTGERQPPYLGNMNLLREDTDHTRTESERKPPFLGSVPTALRDRLESEIPHITGFQKILEDRETTGDTSPHSLKAEDFLSIALIEAQLREPEVETVFQYFAKYIREKNGEKYRLLVSYILIRYSSVEILAVLHMTRNPERNTLLHLSAQTGSEEILREMSDTITAFSHGDTRQKPVPGVRFFIPEEFFTDSKETGRTNLWLNNDVPDLENSQLVQFIQNGNVRGFQEHIMELLKAPGNLPAVLSGFYGRTRSGKSLMDFINSAETARDDFVQIGNVLTKWLTLPFYKRNTAGLTPLNVAELTFKNGGDPSAFILLSNMEKAFHIDTGRQGKTRKSRLAGSSPPDETCRRRFQK